MRRRKGLKKRRQELMEKGEKFSRKEILLCYGVTFILCILLGIGMQVGMACLVTEIILCGLFVPGLYFNYRKQSYERRRFADANIYMSHMVQVFTGTGKILTAMKETRAVFTPGIMQQKLTVAIATIEKSYDVEQSEKAALDEIAKEYDCGRIRTLHDFMLRAQQRGGGCQEEFQLLENIRQLWEKNILKHQNAVRMARNMVTLEYFLLILVCMFMLYQFPEELKIIHLPLVKVVNTFLIVCFFFIFSRLDKGVCKNLLEDTKTMTVKQAKQRLSYIRSFDSKKAIIRQLPWVAAEVVILIMWYVWKPSVGLVVAGALLCLFILCLGHIKYFISVQKVKEEIRQVFPGWLFDVLLLMQRDNVEMSLFKSASNAPAILQEELSRLQRELAENPLSSDVYLTFLGEFQMPQVEGVMRKLYALGNGVGTPGEVMQLIIDENMSMLAEREQQRLRLRGDMMSVYYMLPVLPVMLCMAGYGIALMAVIFQNIMTMI